MSAPRTAAPTAVAWASGALAVGSGLLAIGHSGLRVPVVSALGPGGDDPVVPAAIAFAIAAALHGAVCFGITRRHPWAWPLGILAGAVTLLGAAVPFRGAASLIGMVLAGVEVVGLLLGGTRRELLRSTSKA